MPDLDLTAVPRAAAHLDVWQEPDGTSVQTAREYFGVSDPIGDVTAQTRIAEEAGLLRMRPLAHGPGGAFGLTEAGRVWLAEHDTTTKE